jgi:4-aminobutyrate aminotransferase
MIGIEIVKDQASRAVAGPWRDRIVELAFERGLLILGCGETSIRLAPPLIVNVQEAAIALDILEECVALVEEEVAKPEPPELITAGH